MTTAIDSNILIDILTGTSAIRKAAEATLLGLLEDDDNDLICCDVVYAEVSQSCADKRAMDTLLTGLHIRYDPLDSQSAFVAGLAFQRYRKSGGNRTHILPDFLIGGHALARADRLLTRDRGFLRDYFKDLVVVIPRGQTV